MLSKPLYELLPYVCISAGGVGIVSIENAMGVIAGAILYVMGAIIWTMRFHFRHPAKRKFTRQGSLVKEDLYEFKPFILLAVALALLALNSNVWMFGFGFALCFHSLYIFYMRVHCRV